MPDPCESGQDLRRFDERWTGGRPLFLCDLGSAQQTYQGHEPPCQMVGILLGKYAH